MQELEKKEPRPISIWVWILSFVFFPAGPFLVLAKVKLISWQKAWLSFFGSYAFTIAFAGMMSYVEQNKLDSIIQSAALFSGAIVYFILGLIQYRIGKSNNFWSPQAVRIWKIFFWLVVILTILNITFSIVLAYLD